MQNMKLEKSPVPLSQSDPAPHLLVFTVMGAERRCCTTFRLGTLGMLGGVEGRAPHPSFFPPQQASALPLPGVWRAIQRHRVEFLSLDTFVCEQGKL